MFTHPFPTAMQHAVSRCCERCGVVRLERLRQLTFELRSDLADHNDFGGMADRDAFRLAHAVTTLEEHKEFLLREIDHPNRGELSSKRGGAGDAG